MILGGSCYSELPISSTYLMVKTSNGKVFNFDLGLAKNISLDLLKNDIKFDLFINKRLDLLLPILEKNLNMKIVELDLLISRNIDDIILTRNVQD